MILTLEIPHGDSRSVGAYLDGVFVEKVGYINPLPNIKRVSEYVFEVEGDFEVVRDEQGIGTIKCK